MSCVEALLKQLSTGSGFTHHQGKSAADALIVNEPPLQCVSLLDWQCTSSECRTVRNEMAFEIRNSSEIVDKGEEDER